MSTNEMRIRVILVISLAMGLSFLNPAWAWHDETHMAVARAAGYGKWYNAAGADIAKVKAGDREATNHWFDNNEGVEITPEMVLQQAVRYNETADEEGHLYGAIVQSLRNYLRDAKAGKFADYHMAFCAHYIGDLSQPLHNGPAQPGDQAYIAYHSANDGIVENEALNNVGLIQKRSYMITIKNEEDLAREIAVMANDSHRLYMKMISEGRRNMAKDEAYDQLAKSASLLRAVLRYAAGK